jgi:hypothetical protein
MNNCCGSIVDVVFKSKTGKLHMLSVPREVPVTRVPESPCPCLQEEHHCSWLLLQSETKVSFWRRPHNFPTILCWIHNTHIHDWFHCLQASVTCRRNCFARFPQEMQLRTQFMGG